MQVTECESDLSNYECTCFLFESLDFHQVSEEFATVNIVHHEEYTVFVCKDILHIDKELMVYLFEHFHFQLQGVQALVIQNSVFPDCLHSIDLASCAVLDLEDFSKCSLAY